MNIELLLILIAGHYLADFALQPKFMSEAKALTFIKDIGIHHLTAHAFIHALVAGLLSQRLSVGIVIGVSHWLIDFFRSSDLVRKFLQSKGLIKKSATVLFGLHVDQSFHLIVVAITVWSIA